jgi:hypothetical protein
LFIPSSVKYLGYYAFSNTKLKAGTNLQFGAKGNPSEIDFSLNLDTTNPVIFK